MDKISSKDLRKLRKKEGFKIVDTKKPEVPPEAKLVKTFQDSVHTAEAALKLSMRVGIGLVEQSKKQTDAIVQIASKTDPKKVWKFKVTKWNEKGRITDFEAREV